MSSGLVTAAYIVAAILFIFSLAGLSKQETAKQGCYSGVAGMAVALFVTVFSENTHGLGWIIIAMLIGAAIGIYKAKKVEMTEMPELIALLHSFVGLAAVLVGRETLVAADPTDPAAMRRCGDATAAPAGPLAPAGAGRPLSVPACAVIAGSSPPVSVKPQVAVRGRG